ncbi:hypothetical protein FM037_12485 [Shewanella psychropiezotolerans]|uniref:Lipoprotein n=1 Tax=Shewanella psychropiezotolerans TaxID=2593655 RepID=A0ABX5WXS3_9GAMM|nr:MULTISPECIES: hypothetical protein [Shewanella]MPY24687.1 hypothetical protein [Shewanella sp. YLB-07]QDO83906.1 hypothetical protein FM037_12485 [Shewanella psychropiezotolerans]
MKSKLLLSSLILLCACKPTPYVSKTSQSDINKYFEKQVIKPQGGEVEHIKYGKMAATQEPYATDYNECQNQSFLGKFFMFGELKISDPKKLYQYSMDSLMYQLAFSFPELGLSDITTNPIFEDKEFKRTLDEINLLTSKALICVENKGWIYLSQKKSEK